MVGTVNGPTRTFHVAVLMDHVVVVRLFVGCLRRRPESGLSAILGQWRTETY